MVILWVNEDEMWIFAIYVCGGNVDDAKCRNLVLNVTLGDVIGFLVDPFVTLAFYKKRGGGSSKPLPYDMTVLSALIIPLL